MATKVAIDGTPCVAIYHHGLVELSLAEICDYAEGVLSEFPAGSSEEAVKDWIKYGERLVKAGELIKSSMLSWLEMRVEEEVADDGD